MSDFRNTIRLNYDDLDNLIDFPIDEGQTYFVKDAGVFFKDIHGQRFATLEVDSIDNLNDPDFFIGTKEKLKGRILLIKIANSDAYEWYYIHPEDGQIISLSATDRLSAGIYREPIIDVSSYPISQEFTASACCVNLFTTGDHLGPIKRYTLAPKTWTVGDGEWPPIGATRYIVVNYNGGSPEFQIMDSVASINESDIVPVFTIVRTLNNIHYIGWDQLGAGLANKMHARFVKTQRFARESGLSLSSTFITTNNQSYTWASGATLNTFTGNGYDIKISSGVVWNGAVRTTLEPADSKVDKLRFYFHDTNGNWTYTNTNTIINRRQYDKLTAGGLYTGLSDLGATARYGVAWIYRGVLVDKYIGYVLSNNYYSKTEAINSTPPAMLPDILENLSVLVGKVVFSYIANGDIGDVQVINITGIGGGVSGGAGGVVGNHNDLNGRDATNAHPMSAIVPRGTYPVLTVTSGKNPSEVNLDEVPLTVKSLLSSPLENLQEWWTSNTRKSFIDKDGNFSGKAAKSETLSIPRKINGVDFDGSADIGINPLVTPSTENQNFPIIFSTSGASSSYRGLKVAAPTINASTGAITAPSFIGSLSGNSSSTDQIKTQQITLDDEYFLSFVNENSINRTNKNIYTNSNIKYSIASGIGTLSAPKIHATSNLTIGGIEFSATTNSLTIGKSSDNIIVNGNLEVKGTTTSIDTETLLIKDNIIEINSTQTGTPSSTLISGLEVERGDLANYQFVFVENSKDFRIGESGDLQAVATRSDSPTSNSIFFWNASQKRMDSTNFSWANNQLSGPSIKITGLTEIGSLRIEEEEDFIRVWTV